MRLAFGICFVLLFAAHAVAAPGPPNVQVVQSANGNWLVVTHFEFDSPEAAVSRHVLRTTYEVLQREPFLNVKDHLQTALPFWSQSAFSWHVVLDGYAGFWPLISDDGKSLVLVRVGFGVPQEDVLRIYQKHNFESELVRKAGLADLWPDPAVRAIESQMFTDHSDEWFVGSRFNFAADGELIYQSKWNSVVHVHLNDGVITRER